MLLLYCCCCAVVVLLLCCCCVVVVFLCVVVCCVGCCVWCVVLVCGVLCCAGVVLCGVVFWFWCEEHHKWQAVEDPRDSCRTVANFRVMSSDSVGDIMDAEGPKRPRTNKDRKQAGTRACGTSSYPLHHCEGLKPLQLKT